MTKFQKIQLASSVIPFLSTFFVTLCTIVKLFKNKANVKTWFFFYLTFFLSGIAVNLIIEFLFSGVHNFWSIALSGIVLALANFVYVHLQSVKPQVKARKPKNMKLMYIIIGCVCLVVTTIAVVTVITNPSVDIADTNGDADTTLSAITRDEIISSSNNFSAFSSRYSHKGEATEVTGRMKDYDYAECFYSCKKISGIMTLQATQTSNEQLFLEISSQLNQGNMEIVIIIDGQYYNSIPVNQTQTVVLSGIANKLVLVKIAAESAKMQVSVKRQEKPASIPYLWYPSLSARDEQGVYIITVSKYGNRDKFVHFSDEREILKTNGITPLDIEDPQAFVGMEWSDIIAQYGQPHADVGSGFSIPSYITNNAVLITFDFDDNDIVTEVFTEDLMPQEQVRE